jgi:uncharacterized membrane protein
MKTEKKYHQPSSVEALTAQNIRAIRELEQAAQSQRSSADYVPDFITRFCGSMKFVRVHVAWFA